MMYSQGSVQCLSPSGLHRMVYQEWGERDNPKVLICVHGLTRVSHDFDFLARHLAKDYRVICPDVVGRGRSDRLLDPRNYAIPQYLADMVTLIARLDVPELHWLGTSMGGLIGMALAAQANTPISRLVLNDVGPIITVEALQRIAQYVGADPVFPDFAAALAYVKAISAPFGDLPESEWQHLTQHCMAPREDGSWAFLYDPRIAEPFKAAFVDKDIELWPIYDQIRCPTLVVRGANSDLLSPQTWQQMGERGPRAQLAEVPGVGHAPMFMNESQIDLVAKFLLAA